MHNSNSAPFRSDGRLRRKWIIGITLFAFAVTTVITAICESYGSSRPASAILGAAVGGLIMMIVFYLSFKAVVWWFDE